MNQVCKICRKNDLHFVKEMKGKELKSIRCICFSCGARVRGKSRGKGYSKNLVLRVHIVSLLKDQFSAFVGIQW